MRCEAIETHHYGDRAWVGVSVSDPSGSWHALRHQLLVPPFEPLAKSPHITIVHPRTSDQGKAASDELSGMAVASELLFRSFGLTATDPLTGMVVQQRFDLIGVPR